MEEIVMHDIRDAYTISEIFKLPLMLIKVMKLLIRCGVET